MAEAGQTGRSGARVALVIGNAEYRFGPKLANPIDDAIDIASALGRLGFAPVTLLKNANLKVQNNALADFSVIADEAEMAVIYFAGHGMEVDGENYLLPVDAELDHIRRLKAETMRLSDVMEGVDGAKRFRLVILDACRDNPFRGKMRGLEGTRSIGRGLALVEPQGNTLVAYAARHGTQAKDGKQGSHSPYAQALLNHIETPNVDVRIIFGRVRDEVLQSTDESQEPHIYGTMGGKEVYLKEAALADKSLSQAELDDHLRDLKEELDWEKAQRTNTVAGYNAFIETWRPAKGRFLEDASRRIGDVEEAADFAATAKQKSITAYRDFLSRWPAGLKANDARTALEALEEQEAYAALKPRLAMYSNDPKFEAKPLRDFITQFPKSKHAKDVRSKLEACEKDHGQALQRARFKSEFERYLDNWPDGAHRAEAERLLAGGGDDRLWIEIQKKPEPWLIRRYLQDWPQGRHVADAQKLLPKRETRERWFERGKIAAGGGFFLGGIAVLSAVAYFGTMLVLLPVYRDYIAFEGSTAKWILTRLQERIDPPQRDLLPPVHVPAATLPPSPYLGRDTRWDAFNKNESAGKMLNDSIGKSATDILVNPSAPNAARTDVPNNAANGLALPSSSGKAASPSLSDIFNGKAAPLSPAPQNAGKSGE